LAANALAPDVLLARLDPVELANEVGPLTIPPALPPEKQAPAG